MATPLGVPLISSSNLDCSQVRVPSAKTMEVRMRIEKIPNGQRKRIKLNYLCAQMLGGEFRLSRRGQQKIAHHRHSCGVDIPVRLVDNGDFCSLRSTSSAADKNVRCTRPT